MKKHILILLLLSSYSLLNCSDADVKMSVASSSSSAAGQQQRSGPTFPPGINIPGPAVGSQPMGQAPQPQMRPAQVQQPETFYQHLTKSTSNLMEENNRLKTIKAQDLRRIEFYKGLYTKFGNHVNFAEFLDATRTYILTKILIDNNTLLMNIFRALKKSNEDLKKDHHEMYNAIQSDINRVEKKIDEFLAVQTLAGMSGRK